MRAELILASMLMPMLVLVSPSFAANDVVVLGPYNVSFDMNTTMNYEIYPEQPTSGITSNGLKFVRYNISVETADYFAWLILTRYEKPMIASINSNKDIVEAALMAAGCESPKLYQPLIDGQPGVLGNCRFDDGEILVAASYSPDGKVRDNGEYSGQTDCRVLSIFPWEITRDMLYTLHVEMIEKIAPSNDSEQNQDRLNLTPSEESIKDNIIDDSEASETTYEPLLVAPPMNDDGELSNSNTPSYSGSNCDPVYVEGYYRKDGTYVRPHYRSAPGCG